MTINAVTITAPTLAVEALGLNGEKLGDYKLTEVNFEAAIQWAHFEGVKQGRITPVTMPAPATIIPIACENQGLPYIQGFEVRFSGETRGMNFDLDILHDDVVRESNTLVKQDVLQTGQQFTYRICAFPQEPTASSVEDFSLEPDTQALNIRQAFLPRHFRTCGGSSNDNNLPIVIAQSVIDDAVALAAYAGEKESGGLLLGQLCRDSNSNQIFLEITAFIEAPHAKGTETSLHLGPETFASVEALLDLRNLGEQPVGWAHSHPQFCLNCPDSNRRLCPFSKPFFSEADRQVHRTLFPQAYSPALLISDLGGERPSIDLFGWRKGLIHARDFIQPMQSAPEPNYIPASAGRPH